MNARSASLSRRLARRLAGATEGAAAIEFAIVAPVFLLLILGLFDLGQMVYARALMSGVVEQAARSSSLETNNVTAADAKVKAVMLPIIPNATFSSKRVNYYDFADIGRAEKWTDTNRNGACDNNEPYTDENRSGAWEADIGRTGNGGAGDVVLYTVTMKYRPIFTAKFLANYGTERTISATAVKKNQPFAFQSGYGSKSGTCS